MILAATCSIGRRPRAGVLPVRSAMRPLTEESAGALKLRIAAIETAARAQALAMEFGFLLDRERQLLSIGYSRDGRCAGSQLLRPAGLRGAPGEFHGHRQERRAGTALVPAGPRSDADRQRRGADLVVRIDVRIPDALAGHAGAGRQPAGSDQSPDRAPPGSNYGAELGVPWGISESALQRARPGADLSVLQFRRARPRAQARARAKTS